MTMMTTMMMMVPTPLQRNIGIVLFVVTVILSMMAMQAKMLVCNTRMMSMLITMLFPMVMLYNAGRTLMMITLVPMMPL